PDVVGVLDGTDQPSAIESDIELPRKVIEGAVIDDEMGEFIDERQHVYQLHRIDSGRGVGSEIADVVGTRAARVESDALDAPKNLGCVFRLDEPHLQISAG